MKKRIKLDSSARFKSFSEVWPKGLSELVSELKGLGFNPKPSSLLTSALMANKEYLRGLSDSRSIKFKAPHVNSFGFVGATTSEADLKLAQISKWGLLFWDRSQKNQNVSGVRAIICDAADAALDYVLSKVVAPLWIGESYEIPEGVLSEAQVVIGPNCKIGKGTCLETGVRIGARVVMGENCRIGAHTAISDDSVIGANTRIGASCSIGGFGFGFVRYPGEKLRRPRIHVGRTIIGSNVRLGSFVAIDRGVFDDTVVGNSTSVDNLVQIGHNSTVGEGGIICSLVGLSGSTTLGDRVTIAGLSGTKDHVVVGSDVTIAAQSGVSRNLDNGEVVKGYPPRPLKEALQIQSLQSRLPELFDRLKALEKGKA